MIELTEYIEKGHFKIGMTEPGGKLFLWSYNRFEGHLPIRLDSEDDLDDIIRLAEETKIARKILREKYDKAVKAIA